MIDIENAWLQMIFDPGVVAFVVLLVALGLLVKHWGSTTARALEWMLFLSTVVIASLNQSSGHRRVDFLFLAGCMIVMTSYLRLAPAFSFQRGTSSSPRRTSTRSGVHPLQVDLAGSKL